MCCVGIPALCDQRLEAYICCLLAVCYTLHHAQGICDSAMAVQGIVITDPHLIAEVLQSKDFEKDFRTYRTLDSVSLCPVLLRAISMTPYLHASQPCCQSRGSSMHACIGPTA